MVALLLAGIAATSWQAVRATAEADRANQAERIAEQRLKESEAARGESEQARRDAEAARNDAEAISKFLTSMIQSAEAGGNRRGRDVRVVDLLDTAAKNLTSQLKDQPDRRAKLQATLGGTYWSLGLDQEAILLLEAARDGMKNRYGPDYRGLLDTGFFLSRCYGRVGRKDEQARMLEELVDLHRRLNGPTYTWTMSMMRELANVYDATGATEKATTVRKQWLETCQQLLVQRRDKFGPEDPETLRAMGRLCDAYTDLGRVNESMEMRAELLALRRKVLSPGHPDTLLTMQQLADSYSNAGRKEEALTLREEMLALSDKFQGPDVELTRGAINALSTSYFDAGRTEEALALLKRLLEIRVRICGPEHPDTVLTINGLKSAYARLGRTKELENLPAEIEAIRGKSAASSAAAFWGEHVDDSGVAKLALAGMKLFKHPDGTWEANLTGIRDFSDLTIFQGTPLSRLSLNGTAVIDLSPLRGLALRELSLIQTKVADLEPLRGMPLECLRLTHTEVSDLTPLSGMPLKRLFVNDTKVKDIRPLQGMPLAELSLYRTEVSDLSVLRGMPLVLLKLGKCDAITDISPLRDCNRLQTLSLPPNAKDIGFLRAITTIERISYTENPSAGWAPDKTAEEFWKEYDTNKQ